MAIYACGVLAGISSAYLIFTTTLRPDGAAARRQACASGGCRGPLGAFISAWGGVAMLVSAPFDDWWHNAYGLDVRIISPPHMVLAAGFFGIEFGTIMLLLAFMNRAGAADAAAAAVAVPVRRRHRPSASRCSSSSNTSAAPTCTRRSSTSSWRSARWGFSPRSASRRGSAGRARSWPPCTRRSAWRFCGSCRCFPAEPKLGPVYRQVTHFIPWEFPLLLIVPAFAIDLILQRTVGVAADRPGARRRAGVSRRRSSPCNGRSRFPDVAARAQLVLRHRLHGLQHAGDVAVRALRVLSAGRPPRSSGAAC